MSGLASKGSKRNVEKYRGVVYFFFQAEDGIRGAQESRGLGDVYKRQSKGFGHSGHGIGTETVFQGMGGPEVKDPAIGKDGCLLYTSDAADDLLCVDLGGRRIIKKKTQS